MNGPITAVITANPVAVMNRVDGRFKGETFWCHVVAG